jgi:protein involved in polysaccharide export with SLBB domain
MMSCRTVPLVLNWWLAASVSSARAGCRALVALWLVLGLSAGGAGAQTPESGAEAVKLDSSTVRPGDQLRLKIWREPEMSGDIQVDEAGVATLPRLGPVAVGQMSADSLKRMLIGKYAEFLRDPAIEVTVRRRVTIVGAVRTPGVYYLDPTMTLADALALAGGAASEGKKNAVELRREGERVPATLGERARIADTPLRSGDELFVPERSWVSRNFGLVLAGISTATSLVFIITR